MRRPRPNAIFTLGYKASEKLWELLGEGGAGHHRIAPCGPGIGDELFLDVGNESYNSNRAGGRVSFEGANPIHGGQTPGIEVQEDSLRVNLGNACRAAPRVARNYCNASGFRGFLNLREEEEVVHQGHQGCCQVIALPYRPISNRDFCRPACLFAAICQFYPFQYTLGSAAPGRLQPRSLKTSKRIYG